MAALATDLRNRLDRAIREARVVAERGAKHALEALAVDHHEYHGSMSVEERALRNRLRAHGRQLGDVRDKRTGKQPIARLVREVAYEHWHRMLFARFLAENDLLIEPQSGVAITLEECEELARECDLDPWAMAASFAQDMLPQIFRPDDPALQVTMPPETRQSLQGLLSELPSEVFTADDSLGWTYQFWQSAEKDAVNARVKSGEKITGETLPAVTQLFTEPYMVQFLLHNTIGAWHAGKVLAERPDLADSGESEQDLRDAAALDGYTFEYLRLVREPKDGDEDGEATGPWRPAAGAYTGWPRTARELTVLDPCCGSGHFLVAALDLLVRLRSAEEGLGLEDAVRAVLEDNLFALELDPRCTQIAAFHLALAAWRAVGHPTDLPPLHIACSGVGPQSTKSEWLALAERAAARGGMPAKKDLFGSEESLLSSSLKRGLEALYDQFALAPELGSLIDPQAGAGDLLTADYGQLQPLLNQILEAERDDDSAHELAVAAQGMARAAEILTGSYTLVMTNFPYLGRGSQSELLKEFADAHFKEARADLATLFVARTLRWTGGGAGTGTMAVVTPQNWLFLGRSAALRHQLLTKVTWSLLAQLGPGAFETISGEVVKPILLVVTASSPRPNFESCLLDLSRTEGAERKSRELRGAKLDAIPQASQLRNPDFRVTFSPPSGSELLTKYSNGWQGIAPSDTPRFVRCFWELRKVQGGWHFQQSSPTSTQPYSGREHILFWQDGHGAITEVCQAGATFRGEQAWGKVGVSVAQIGLKCTIYQGEKFDGNAHALVPFSAAHAAALWCYCTSERYPEAIRRIDRKLSVTNSNMAKVPFELEHWMQVASTVYPDGLPEPCSDDPTQWLFHGHPAHAEEGTALQVAAARLLGYRWPAELDTSMRLASGARAVVERCAELASHADKDGIVCLSSVQGEGTAADRLRSLLAKAFGSNWSAAREQDLLEAAGGQLKKRAPAIEDWLRDHFFLEHCALFRKRPFIWHVWDGRPDGFHALVNYQRLAGPDGEGLRTLEALTFTYLGEWIERQRQQVAADEEGADGRLAAAMLLQHELREIIDGEPPYDIFARWKPLRDQPQGWTPDMNDGVRVNIRPFLMAQDLKSKNAGILRAKPDNTWCNAKKRGVKDRGKEPKQLRPRRDFPWFWSCDPEGHPEHRIDYGGGTQGSEPASEEFDGARWNGLHYTRAAKEAARLSAAARTAEEPAS